MPDNWNKLADLLGTPSIDPIERKIPSPKTPPKTTPAAEKKTLTNEGPSVEAESNASDVATPASLEPVVEAKSRFKSTWDAVADFFGVSTPAKEDHEPTEVESPAPEARTEKRAKSFWPSDEDASDRSQKASQQVSDELFGRRDQSARPEDDLESLLAGFRVRPDEAIKPEADSSITAEATSPAARGERPQRGERRDGRRGDRTSGREQFNEARPSRSSERSGRTERGRPSSERRPVRDTMGPVDDTVESVADELPVETRRPERSSRRRSSVEDGKEIAHEGAPDRRGPRRRPRRELASDEPVARTSESDDIEIIERNDDSTSDVSGRRERRWSRERGGSRGSRERAASGNGELSGETSRTRTPRKPTSAWEDPELVETPPSFEEGMALMTRSKAMKRRQSVVVDEDAEPAVIASLQTIWQQLVAKYTVDMPTKAKRAKKMLRFCAPATSSRGSMQSRSSSTRT